LTNDKLDGRDRLIGQLMGNVRDKVSPGDYSAFKGLTFSEIDSAQPDPNDPNAAQAQAHDLDVKGFIEQQAGELDAALKFYQQALALREAAVPRENTVVTQHKLVLSYDNVGDVHAALALAPNAKTAAEQAEALKFYQQSLDM